MDKATGQLESTPQQGEVAVAGPTGPAGWQIEIEQGPNRGAVLALEIGKFSIGAGLSNDIILADATVAGEQATLSLDGHTAILRPLAPGISVEGKEIPAGASVAIAAGTVIHAGDTVMKMHGPRVRRPWWVWTMLAVPVILLATFGAALVGFTSPSADKTRAPVRPAATNGPAASSAEAVSVLGARLQEAGLGDRVTVSPGSGAVIAEGVLPAADMSRWADQQVWFDGRYKGTLSLVSRVRLAGAEEVPNLKVSAVSTGATPYIITSNGDRFVEGAVVDGGWTIEKILADRVILSRGGKRVEVAL